jgi:hypothetical protein
MSCPYKYVLGIPEKGVHSIRVLGFALFDIIATIILSGITAYFSQSNFFIHLGVWLVIGEILHYVYGTQTKFLTTIGVDACPENKN